MTAGAALGSNENPHAYESVTTVTPVTPSADAGCSVTNIDARTVTAVTTKAQRPPDPHECPCFRTFWTGWSLGGVSKLAGLYYFEKTNNQATMEAHWISGPIEVLAATRDQEDNSHGRQLRFRNSGGRERTTIISMAQLAKGPNEICAALMDSGLQINTSSSRSKAKLLDFINQPLSNIRELLCAQQVGWLDETYVLPSQAYGPHAHGVVLQPTAAVEAGAFTTKGTLKGWREAIASPAVGNNVLTLAICAAFTGPLISICGGESGGFHLVGNSSTGKTSMLVAATSVWGPTKPHLRSWSTTANGLEATGVHVNDGLLALDEISQASPDEVFNILYSTANGMGKARMSRDGIAKPIMRWRCIVLSTGERSIGEVLRQAQRNVQAGQEMRIVNIDVGGIHGAYDELHNYNSGAALSIGLHEQASRNFGAAGHAFLDHLCDDKIDHKAEMKRILSSPAFVVREGQQQRVAQRFALAAYAGELATRYGITGWEQGYAEATMQAAFKTWVSQQGAGPHELMEGLARLERFIEKHETTGFSERFEPLPDETMRKGWAEEQDGDKIFHINRDVFESEIVGGLHAQSLKKDLIRENVLLQRNGECKYTTRVVANADAIRLYHVSRNGLQAIVGGSQ